MIIFKHISDLSFYISEQQTAGKKIGFVPTMGALHEGHLTLIKESNQKTDLTVCSIFVNPTQFNDPKDFEKYPITIEKDIQLLVQENCDLLFLPEVAEMYPNGSVSSEHYDLGSLETRLEGFFRPRHFQGVCTIVDKLLAAVHPDLLFMGQKDFQQCMVIRRLLELKFPNIELVIVPTVREADGLAMSSRNVRLSNEGRKKAVVLHDVLLYISENIKSLPFDIMIEEGKKKIHAAGFSHIDYLEICDPKTLENLTQFKPNQSYAILVAAFLDDVRLIDNMQVQSFHS